jgi:hypothetical protein
VQTAAIHAVRGDAATALEWLERGYRAGWNDARALRRDPFFQSPQRNPRFTMLLRNMSADITKLRDGVQSISDSLLQVTRDQLASSGGR